MRGGGVKSTRRLSALLCVHFSFMLVIYRRSRMRTRRKNMSPCGSIKVLKYLTIQKSREGRPTALLCTMKNRVNLLTQTLALVDVAS